MCKIFCQAINDVQIPSMDSMFQGWESSSWSLEGRKGQEQMEMPGEKCWKKLVPLLCKEHSLSQLKKTQFSPWGRKVSNDLGTGAIVKEVRDMARESINQSGAQTLPGCHICDRELNSSPGWRRPSGCREGSSSFSSFYYFSNTVQHTDHLEMGKQAWV